MYPTRVPVKFEQKKGTIAMVQITTVDKKRIVKTLGILTSQEIKWVKEKIKETFVN